MKADDEGKLHTNKFNNIIYFTDSPFNVLISNALAEYIHDHEVTWLLTKRKFLFFLGILGGTEVQWLTKKIVFHH